MTVQHFPSAAQGSDIRLDVARGLINGHKQMYKFGFNGALAADTEETVWDGSNTYVYPSSAAVMYVSSSSTADDDGSTGATEIKVEGLDENYNEVSETVTMDGRTQVATTTEFLRVHRAFVTAVGSGGTAAGDIYVGTTGATNGVPTGDYYAKITQGENQTLQAVFTVPAGKTLYIDDASFSTGLSTGNKIVVFRLKKSVDGEDVMRTQLKKNVQEGTHTEHYSVPLAFAEKTDIEVTATSDVANAEASATFQGMLIDNDYDI